MKKLIVSLLFALGLVSCSNEVPEPDIPEEVVPNASRLLSICGPDVCYDFEYDDMGKVISAKLFQPYTSYFAEYKYDKDHIYVSYRQYDKIDNITIYHEDTLFLVDGRVDSCAGQALTDYRIRYKLEAERFHLKFCYNERDEMIYWREEIIVPVYIDPWHYSRTQIKCYDKAFEWKDGNIVHTAYNSITDKVFTNHTYTYTSQPGNNYYLEPRSVIPDLYALVLNGYFGVACKNLAESCKEDDGSRYLYYYKRDNQQRIVTIEELREYDENYIDNYRGCTFYYKWDDTVKSQE